MTPAGSGSASSGPGFDVSGEISLSLSIQTDGDVTSSFDAGASVNYEILGAWHSWSGDLSFSETVNIASLGNSLWDDIEDGLEPDVLSKLSSGRRYSPAASPPSGRQTARRRCKNSRSARAVVKRRASRQARSAAECRPRRNWSSPITTCQPG